MNRLQEANNLIISGISYEVVLDAIRALQ